VALRSVATLVPALFLGAGMAVSQELVGDAEAGKEVFKQCSACHMVGPDAKHRVGPHLNGIFRPAAASHEDFKYSDGLIRAGTSGVEWHADTLDAFIENPRNIASRTRMGFRGIEDEQDRLNLIAYLRTYSDNPANIPEADPTARPSDHDLDPAILALVGDPEYGEYLSSECKTCHQVDGMDDGIPSIVYWPEEDFVAAMHAYKNKQRSHPVMQMIAGRLGDEEIAALAAYFTEPE
jgi:cytochrome c